MVTKTEGNTAAQVAAVPTTENQTVATATPSIETVNTATVATLRKKMPPKKRAAAAKESKEPKRLTGVLVYIALVSYNHWRSFVNDIINGEDKTDKMIAAFRKDETAIEGTKCGGYIATPAENVDEVLAILNGYTTANNAKPANEQVIDMWSILEHFQTVEPKPRADRKPKAEEATTEVTTDVTTDATTEATAEVVA